MEVLQFNVAPYAGILIDWRRKFCNFEIYELNLCNDKKIFKTH